MRRDLVTRLVGGLVLLAVCAAPAAADPIQPGADAQKRIQEALLLVEPGEAVELGAGTFELNAGLSLDVDDVTVRGAGMDQTILSFKGQKAGSEGLLVTSSGVVLEDFTIEDTKGDGFKSKGSKGITYRRVRARWTGGPKETNGAYGLYPVESENVLIEGCVAEGASDAGIYVGQSRGVIVRHSRAEYNVAGIEIENCFRADVYENVATNNTGGVLVFDLPGLPQQGGHDVRVFNNLIVRNNHPNFAPEGNIVGKVPPGTGVIIMANRNVEVFHNVIRRHDTANVQILSYHITGNTIEDPKYYPYPEQIHIHDNVLGESGAHPAGDIGQSVAQALGTPVPDIVWDGMVNPEAVQEGAAPPDPRISIHNNVHETFGDFDLAGLSEGPEHAEPSRDLKPHREPLPPVPPVTIPGVD